MKKQFGIVVVICANILIALAVAYALMGGPRFTVLIMVLAGVLMILALRGTEIGPADPSQINQERHCLIRRLYSMQKLAALLFGIGLAWTLISLQFIGASTPTGLFLTLGVGMVACFLGALCLVYDFIRCGIFGRDD